MQFLKFGANVLLIRMAAHRLQEGGLAGVMIAKCKERDDAVNCIDMPCTHTQTGTLTHSQ